MDIIYSGTICFLLGLYIALQNFLYGSYSIYLISTLLCLSLCCVVKHKKLTFILFSLGLMFLGITNGLYLQPNADVQLKNIFYQEVKVQGRLEPLTLHQSGQNINFTIQCSEIFCNNNKENYNGCLYVSVPKKSLAIASGEVIVKGTLLPLTSFRNPGGFNSNLYNKIHNLGGRLKNTQVLFIREDKNLFDYLSLLNKELHQKIVNNTSEKIGNILSGMILGGNRVDEITREVFAANGLVHLLSVSGTHLLLLTLLLQMILKPLPLIYRKTIILVILILYAGICGLRPPVLRALFMSSIVLFTGNNILRGRLLCITMIILLLFKPLWIFDIGMQLSFAATAGIIWLSASCRKILCSLLPEFLLDGVVITLASQLAVLPFLVIYFHQISLISIFSNILLVPILELAALLGLLGCIFPWNSIFLQYAAFLVEQILLSAQWLSNIPYSNIVIGILPAWSIVIYYFLLIIWIDLPCLPLFSSYQRKFILGSLMLILGGLVSYQYFLTIPLTAYFLDVGQGDCCVIITPKQKIIVCDTGGLINMSTAKRILIPFLHSLGYNKVDYLLLSHFDYDHVGGASDLMRGILVKNLILPHEKITAGNKAIYKEILASAAPKTKVIFAATGKKWYLQETELILLDVPREEISGNDAGTLAVVKNGNNSILLTGDISEKREEKLQLTKSFTLLKVGHHGSKYSSSKDFLEQVNPKISVISCGQNNHYRHPHKETLERLQNSGSFVLRTDKYGCLKIIFTDKQISCYSYKNNYWQRLPYNS